MSAVRIQARSPGGIGGLIQARQAIARMLGKAGSP